MTESLGIVSEKTDEIFMREALRLAAFGQGYVEPNPMVGCVLVRDHRVIGQGYHRQFGGPHAEIEALRSLSASDQACAATAYVSLEPCCHHGKTPPCSQALIDAGIRRLVVAMSDPFPQVDGGGLRQLKDAGVQVELGVLRDEAEVLNAPYLKRVRSGRPWVIAKWAMTMDGRIATTSGESQWITGDESRAQVHRLRGRVDAVAVGMGTVEADDPMLNARINEESIGLPRVAKRVVFGRHRVPKLESRLVRSANEIPLILVVGPDISSTKRKGMRSAGAALIETESDEGDEMVTEALDALGEMGMTNVMLEGGADLLASFLSADEIDECHVYMGPKVFGGQSAKGPIGGVGITAIELAKRFELVSIERLEGDIRAVYRRMAR